MCMHSKLMKRGHGFEGDQEGACERIRERKGKRETLQLNCILKNRQQKRYRYKEFLNQILAIPELRLTIDKWDIMKQEASVQQRKLSIKQRGSLQNGEKPLSANRELMSRTHKELKKLNTKKRNNPWK